MATDIKVLGSFAGVPPDVYAQAEAYIQQLLAEAFPDRDFGTGKTLYWNVVVPAAISAASSLVNNQLISESMFLKAVRNNPDLASEDLVELLLSNYFISKKAGAFAAGTVTIVVTRLNTYAIPSGTVFSAGAQTYAATENIYAYANAAQAQRPQDRVLTARSDGRWQFTVPVQAQTEGAGAFLRSGTLLTMSNQPTEVYAVVASGDIAGGEDAETTAEVIDRIPQTLAAQTTGSRASISAIINASFPGVNVEVTGFGDAEMSRDSHNLLGVATGGCADIWVSTQASVQQKTIVATAELISVASKRWRVVVPAAELPGIYAVTGVRPDGEARDFYSPTANIRGFNIPTSGYRPNITLPHEAAFSSYQTITVEFTDSMLVYAGRSVGDTADFELQCLSMPLVADINDLMTAKTTLAPGLNVLVRGAVPCVVKISMVVRLLDGDFAEDIDIDAMKSALTTEIFRLGFGFGVLSAAAVTDVVHDYLSGRSDVGSTQITLSASLYAPTGEVMYFADAQELRIPNIPSQQVSSRTTVFLTSPDDIDIQFTRVEVQ